MQLLPSGAAEEGSFLRRIVGCVGKFGGGGKGDFSVSDQRKMGETTLRRFYQVAFAVPPEVDAQVLQNGFTLARWGDGGRGKKRGFVEKKVAGKKVALKQVGQGEVENEFLRRQYRLLRVWLGDREAVNREHPVQTQLDLLGVDVHPLGGEPCADSVPGKIWEGEKYMLPDQRQPGPLAEQDADQHPAQ